MLACVQHLMHAMSQNGVRRWVALSEGAGGTVGWLTTNERKEVCCSHYDISCLCL